LGQGGTQEAGKAAVEVNSIFGENGERSLILYSSQVMPGLLLCFVLRYDAYKKSQLLLLGETGLPPPRHLNRVR